MTIGHLDDTGGIEQVGWASEVVRLGEGLDRSGKLDAGRIELAVDTLRRFEQQAREMGAIDGGGGGNGGHACRREWRRVPATRA